MALLVALGMGLAGCGEGGDQEYQTAFMVVKPAQYGAACSDGGCTLVIVEVHSNMGHKASFISNHWRVETDADDYVSPRSVTCTVDGVEAYDTTECTLEVAANQGRVHRVFAATMRWGTPPFPDGWRGTTLEAKVPE